MFLAWVGLVSLNRFIMKTREPIDCGPIDTSIVYEEREHINDESCWCHPQVFFEADNGNRVWTHKGRGDELPPASILAAAIADAIADRED
jgi:hypothetical protein